MTHSPVPMADYLRVIGRGKDGARSLNRTQAQDLMTRLLAGQLSALEKGGFALAMRLKPSKQKIVAYTEQTAGYFRVDVRAKKTS